MLGKRSRSRKPDDTTDHAKRARIAADGKDQKEENDTTPLLWALMWTDFTDDYKPRGGDWSSTNVQYFANQARAQSALREKLLETVDDLSLSEDYSRAKLQHMPLDELETLVTENSTGEFVNVKYDWSLQRIKFSDDKYEDYVAPEPVTCAVPDCEEDAYEYACDRCKSAMCIEHRVRCREDESLCFICFDKLPVEAKCCQSSKHYSFKDRGCVKPEKWTDCATCDRIMCPTHTSASDKKICAYCYAARDSDRCLGCGAPQTKNCCGIRTCDACLKKHEQHCDKNGTSGTCDLCDGGICDLIG